MWSIRAGRGQGAKPTLGRPAARAAPGWYLSSPFAGWSTFAGYRRALDSLELPAALADLDQPGAQVRVTIQRTRDLSLDARRPTTIMSVAADQLTETTATNCCQQQERRPCEH